MRSESSDSSLLAGFSLLETLVAMALSAVVGGALLSGLSVHLRVTRQQVEKAELRQSLRIARLDLGRALRLAGRGGLPSRCAVSSVQNAGSALRLGRERVAEGTDVLILRGAFDSPVWRVASLRRGSGVGAGGATLVIDEALASGSMQSLGALEAMLAEESGQGALLWLSGSSGHDLARIESGSIETFEVSDGDSTVERRRITLDVRLASGDPGFASIHGGLTPVSGFSSLRTVRTAALVQETRFFVREPPSGAEEGQRRHRVLSMARMVPGTDVVLKAGSGAGYDISDDVRDLQVAIGVVARGSKASAGEDGEALSLIWLHSGDSTPDPEGPIRAVRISLLGEALSVDRSHRAAAIDRIEDHEYGESADPSEASLGRRRYRRLETRLQVRLRSP